MSVHAITSLLVFIYLVNAGWYAAHGYFGNCWYWLAAAQISIAATWFTN